VSNVSLSGVGNSQFDFFIGQATPPHRSCQLTSIHPTANLRIPSSYLVYFWVDRNSALKEFKEA